MKNLPSRQEIKDRQKAESPIESILLREFQLIGKYPVPQFWIGKYRIDLAFPKELIAIECDGKEWHSTEEQKARDQEKDNYLKEMGWQVVRITGSEIYRRADDIVKTIIGIPMPKRGFQRRTFITVDYENDSPEVVQEKEEMIKDSIDGASVDGEFKKIGDIIAERYKYSI